MFVPLDELDRITHAIVYDVVLEVLECTVTRYVAVSPATHATLHAPHPPPSTQTLSHTCPPPCKSPMHAPAMQTPPWIEFICVS